MYRYIKFSPVGNEHLEQFLQEQDCAYRMGGFLNYAIYMIDAERGILKKLHERYPNVNIQTVEYDYDSARTLRESRIMLGISNEPISVCGGKSDMKKGGQHE